MNEFKLIVAGGRDFNNYPVAAQHLIYLAENDLADVAVSIVSGMARGADAMGVHFAQNHQVKLYEFPADWKQYGKAAGFRRNAEMAEFSDGLLAFWDGSSRGTADMIHTMTGLNKYVYVVRY